MIKKIVFLMNYPLNLRDYTRFGAEILKNNGFEVLFFNFSPFMSPALQEKAAASNFILDYQGHFSFDNEKDAIAAISKLPKECFAVVLMHYSPKTFRIYRALSKAKIQYAVCAVNFLPGPFIDNAKTNRIFKRIFRLTFPKMRRYFISLLFHPRLFEYLGVCEAKICLAGGAKFTNDCLQAYPFGKNTSVLYTHALDYDIYLENAGAEKEDTGEGDYKRSVFLSGGAPQFLGDDVTLSKKWFLSEERYYPSLCKFFDKVESETGVKIEIAAHPRSKDEINHDYFSGRLAVRDKTFQMIKHARFVITHNSTAANFAVLFKKPIIFITTDEHEASIAESGYIKAMAFALGKKPINIGRPYKIDWPKELFVDEAKYAGYKNDYIKKSGSEKLNSWQIFANYLKGID